MIRGTTLLNLDSKGRLAIPSRYRSSILESCAGRFTVTLNNTQQNCLWLYPTNEWEKVEKKLIGLSSFVPLHVELKRYLIGSAIDLEMDGSGRILLPANLREISKLNKSVQLVGQGNKFEIWDSELWNESCAQFLNQEIDLSEISNEMEQLSL